MTITIITLLSIFAGFIVGYVLGAEDRREDRLFGRMDN